MSFALSCLFVLTNTPSKNRKKKTNLINLQNCRVLIEASLPFRGSDSSFRYGCLAEYALGTHKHLYACVPLTGRTHTSARQLSQRRRGRGVSNNRFVCPPRPFQKHGCGYTAGALLMRTREQPPLRFHSHVTETMFMIFIISKEKENAQAIFDYII